MAMNELMALVDKEHLAHAANVSGAHRASLGQFFTSSQVASFMAGLFTGQAGDHITLLDAGAGVGSLTASFIERYCVETNDAPAAIEVYAFELDPAVKLRLARTLMHCQERCKQKGIRFSHHLVDGDFIEIASAALQGELLGGLVLPRFSHAILNPPYAKLSSDSKARRYLRQVGIETSNYYTAFIWLSTLLLREEGQLVAITPRSFCNGTYFRPFRAALLRTLSLERLHVFDSRQRAFSDDSVLQENIIFKGTRRKQIAKVTISSSEGPGLDSTSRSVEFDQVVDPRDPERYIHLKVSANDERISRTINELPATLFDLGVQVSTGRVVDFRAKEHLRKAPVRESVPLLYPAHFENRVIRWPKLEARKPNALALSPSTEHLLVPAGTYVLTKRFTSKEENRRLVAALCDPDAVPGDAYAFENHLNFFHANGHGLSRQLALGLWGYLNSSILDAYFRLFSGHTQVNATDLRNLRYPSAKSLQVLGQRIARGMPSLGELDILCASTLYADPSNSETKRRKKDHRGARSPSLV